MSWPNIFPALPKRRARSKAVLASPVLKSVVTLLPRASMRAVRRAGLVKVPAATALVRSAVMIRC